jgi:hypothetical protein
MLRQSAARPKTVVLKQHRWIQAFRRSKDFRVPARILVSEENR